MSQIEVIRISRRDPVVKTTIRELAEEDLGGVYALWSESVQEVSPPPKQLDRWGPGVAVFVPPEDEASSEEAYELTPTEPGQAVHQTLRRLLGNPIAGCLVAESHRALAGFVIYSVQRHPAMPGRSGAIDMLFVQPRLRRSGIGRALVSGAVEALHRRRAYVIRAEYEATDRTAARFWARLGWSRRSKLVYLYDE